MDKLFIIPHTHYDAEVFLPREEFLEVGYKVIFDALNALRSDPQYKYTLDQSSYIQPFLLAYPELRDTFYEMVQCGRLEIAGGMFVMSDLNVVSGESIIRQFEFGRGFFEKELSADVKTGWMIDTFGHCAQMPQIMKKCGFEYYVFCRVADLRHSDFYWQGIDGTQILTHWASHHYIVFCDSPGWFKGFQAFAKERYDLLKPYSATGAMAAFEGGDFTYPIRHDTTFANQWNSDPGRPCDLVVGTPREFFAEVLKSPDKLAVVTDDFNPVFQGCYSARIRVKQLNRKTEAGLYEAEVWNALSRMLGGADSSRTIQDAWELMLFNQGHDDMGGVQMDKVFEHVLRRYAQAEGLITLAQKSALAGIAGQVDTRGEGIPLIVLNSLNWARTEKATAMVAYDTDDVFTVGVTDSHGSAVPVQTKVLERYPNGAIRQAQLLFIATSPALGYEVYRVLKNAQNPYHNPYLTKKWYGFEELDEGILENEFIILKVDLWKGCITSLVLKETGEEYIDEAMPFGNMLVKDEDNGDFWEIGTPLRGGANRPITKIQPLDRHKANTELSVDKGGSCFIREGDVCTEFDFSLKCANFEFDSTIRLYAGSRSVEIESKLVNRQKNVRYRIAFPTSIRGGTVTHGIPFGSIQRPEGEYPALHWADYSGAGRGLGLINSGLPGNAVVDDKMMLSIMKCTSFVSYGGGGYDSANSSEGGHELHIPHTFRYTLVPHRGDWREAGLHRRGEEINHPLIVLKAPVHGGSLPPASSFVSTAGNPQVMVSCLRACGTGIMLRVWEATGCQASAVRLTLGWQVAGVIETDMLGGSIESSSLIQRDGSTFVFDLKPYEVRTFRVDPA